MADLAETWCYDTCETVDRVEIIGDKGKLTFPVFGCEFVLTVDGQAQTMDFIHPTFIQEPMIHSVIDMLLGECEALCPIETALRTARVMEKICRK
ncbi:MAG: hypothetical protein RSB57_03245 [Hungatella sp.]